MWLVIKDAFFFLFDLTKWLSEHLIMKENIGCLEITCGYYNKLNCMKLMNLEGKEPKL